MNKFQHTVYLKKIEGTHFEIGKKLGEYVRKTKGSDYINDSLNKLSKSFLYKNLLGMRFKYDDSFIEKNSKILEPIIKKIHPSMLEEIEGFVEGLREDYKRALMFVVNLGSGFGCSHFYTKGYHVHNYDFSPEYSDNHFLLLDIDGSYSSVGFSEGFIGRVSGMNEKGLAVSLSFGGGYIAKEAGLGVIFFLRLLLDKAADVEEALDIFERVQYISPNTLLISDAKGEVVVIEHSCAKSATRRIKGNYIFAANSYLTSQMKQEQKIKNPTTTWREKKMAQVIPKLKTKEEIINFTISDYPEGIFEPYFLDELGTLWSVIFEPEKLETTVVLGTKNQEVKKIRFSLKDELKRLSLPTSLAVNLISKNLP